MVTETDWELGTATIGMANGAAVETETDSPAGRATDTETAFAEAEKLVDAKGVSETSSSAFAPVRFVT